VVINHTNGSQTLYAHMSSVSVTEGSSVAKGDRIGAIGATGKVHGTTGCHVHFEIRNGPTNPF
jgi:murein DD-endopeptidase MepM/ murein hydrolase activator NlpD